MAWVAFVAAAVVQAGVSYYQGEQSKKNQKKSLGRQAAAQDQSQIAALRQARENELAVAAANKRNPDLQGILAAEGKAATAGAGSTMLTGPRGIDPSRLGLGRPSLLGL